MDEKKYIIKVVYDLNGNKKPERIGRITKRPFLTKYGNVNAEYISLADGTPYEGKMLSTSSVTEWFEDGKRILFGTLNSKYIFEEVADEQN